MEIVSQAFMSTISARPHKSLLDEWAKIVSVLTLQLTFRETPPPLLTGTHMHTYKHTILLCGNSLPSIHLALNLISHLPEPFPEAVLFNTWWADGNRSLWNILSLPNMGHHMILSNYIAWGPRIEGKSHVHSRDRVHTLSRAGVRKQHSTAHWVALLFPEKPSSTISTRHVNLNSLCINAPMRYFHFFVRHK